MILRLPPGFVVAEKPASERAISPALDVAFEVAFTAGEVHLRRALIMKPGRYPKETYPESQTAWRLLSAVRQKVMVLRVR
jgi:hypothetical protein